MHDMSVAQAVTEEVLKRLKGKKVSEVEVDLEVGHLRFHDTGQVEFWLGEMLRKELGKGLKVKAGIKVIDPEIRCGCGFRGKAGAIHTTEELSHHGVFELECPECRSRDVEIEKGNEVLIRAVRAR